MSDVIVKYEKDEYKTFKAKKPPGIHPPLKQQTPDNKKPIDDK